MTDLVRWVLLLLALWAIVSALRALFSMERWMQDAPFLQNDPDAPEAVREAARRYVQRQAAGEAWCREQDATKRQYNEYRKRSPQLLTRCTRSWR